MFQHILVPLDGSPLAECVLPHTIAFARVFKAQVTLLRTLTSPQAGTAVDAFKWYMDKAEAEAYVDRVAMHLQTVGVPTETVVVAGQPIDIVTSYVHNQQIDLVILSSHGAGGITESNMGSVAQNILLRSRVSSLLVRATASIRTEQTDLQYHRLLVPLDGSLRATHVLPLVATFARLHDAQVLLAHVLSRPDMPHYLPLSPEHKALAEQLATLNHTAVTRYFVQLVSQLPHAIELSLLEHKDVASSLHELGEAEGVDLVVLSAHGYSGGSQWPYGSIAVNFMAHSATPLLLVQDWSSYRAPIQAQGAAREGRSDQGVTSDRLPSARPYDRT